jgi:hypothetical protein
VSLNCLGRETPQLSFEDGVVRMLEDIEHWTGGPLSDPGLIADATKSWFAYPGDDSKAEKAGTEWQFMMVLGFGSEAQRVTRRLARFGSNALAPSPVHFKAPRLAPTAAFCFIARSAKGALFSF